MSRIPASIALILAFILLVQIVPADLYSAPMSNDLYIADVDIIQVTFDPDTIIKNKSTGLRLVVVSTFQVNVNTDFRVDYDFGTKNLTDRGMNGEGFTLSPGQNIVYLPGGSRFDYQMWDTDPMTLRWTMTGTDFDLWVTVDPLHRVDEVVENNNILRFTEGVEVKYAHPMRLLVVPIYNDAGGQYEFEEHLNENVEVLRDQYPVADDGINVTIAPWEHREYEDHNEAADIARSFSDDARAMGYDRVIVVFKVLYYGSGQLYGRACGMLRDPEDRTVFLVTLAGLAHSSDLLAHELGHTYYLWHPHDIGLELYETDVWYPLERMYDREASTTMSYDWKLPEGVPSWPRWMDEQRYRTYPKTWIDLSDEENLAVDGVWQWNLYDQFVTYPILRGPSVLITGKLFLNGSAIFGQHVQHLASAPRDLEQAIGFINSGNYSIKVLDPSRSPLGTFSFQASFDEMAHWDSITEVYERRLNEVDFAFNIPEVPGGRYLQLVNETGAVLVERTISDHSPSVQITSPEGDEEVEVGDVLNVTWEGSDADGDDLTYRLAFSPDGGCTWIPIADELTADSYRWSTSGLRPGGDHLIRVIASDGYNSGEGVSQEFVMADTTPPITEISLEGTQGQNGWYVSTVGVTLNATDNCCVERTEFSFDGTNWTDRTGPFNVTDEGEHDLRYRSIDGQGNVEATKSADIRIDMTSPAVHIDSIVDGSSMGSGDHMLNWTSSDAVSGVTGHKVRLDGENWSGLIAGNQLQLFGMADGHHTVEVMAIDEAGNTNVMLVGFTVETGTGPPYLLILAGIIAVCAIIGLAYMILRRRRP